MNKNILMLSKLYDAAAHELQQALASERVTFNDPRIVDKVKSLGEIAKTLSLVYQIESMRAKATNKPGDVALPEEQHVVDPAANKTPVWPTKDGSGNRSKAPPTDLSGFRSPGGWTP